VPEPQIDHRLDSPAGTRGLRRNLAPHAGLISLLTVATLFEGFDTKLAGLVGPMLGEDFAATNEELGLVLGLSSLGMVIAFFIIHLADWIGRRPVFLGALAGYATLTLATALSPNLVVYTSLQFFARMAMVVELSLAYLILSETLSGDVRGRANGILGAFAALGAAVPLALLAPLEAIGIGWRGLFVLGAIPLLLFPLYVVRLEETRVYREQVSKRAERRFDLNAEWQLVRALLRGAGAKRLAGVALLWFTVNFWAGTTMGFLTIYTFGERGWDARDVAWLPLGTIPFGIAGYLLCGVAMDRFGRRGAATIYLIGAFVVTVCCYQSESKTAIYLAWSLLVGLNGIWTIATTWTLELFPTELRATALGVSANLLGRLGMVLGPILAGSLSMAWSSTSNAVSVLAGITLLCIPAIWWALPETLGIELSDSENALPIPVELETNEVPNQPVGI